MRLIDKIAKTVIKTGMDVYEMYMYKIDRLDCKD